MSLLMKNSALSDLLEEHLPRLCEEEGLAAPFIKQAIDDGVMVCLGNPGHQGLRPVLVGQPAKIKVNANIGTSPWCMRVDEELNKLGACLEAGAHTIMDLSIAGDLEAIRTVILNNCPAPLGTVPLYAVAQRYLAQGKDAADFTPDDLLREIEAQAYAGVDFMTVHCGLTRRAALWAAEHRKMGIVSRGGSILTRYMQRHDCENPLLTHYEAILDIARQYNVTLSLGDGLRPGAGLDSGDAAQWDEVIMLGRLARQGVHAGVQCMIEGPGHVPLKEVEGQIRAIKKLTAGAPLYVLGPLVTDVSPGYDHIAGAIGGALAVSAGADFLCYLTPAEHLTLPNLEDVRAGVMASRVAAQAGEVACGYASAAAREEAMNAARKSLNWGAMAASALDPAMVRARRAVDDEKKEACSMCGEFCAIKMANPSL